LCKLSSLFACKRKEYSSRSAGIEASLYLDGKKFSWEGEVDLE